MEAETSHLPLTRLVHYFRSYLDCQLKQGNLLKKE